MDDGDITEPGREPVLAPDEGGSPWTRRRVAIGVAVVVVILGGIVAAIALSGSDDSSPPAATGGGSGVSNDADRTSTSQPRGGGNGRESENGGSAGGPDGSTGNGSGPTPGGTNSSGGETPDSGSGSGSGTGSGTVAVPTTAVPPTIPSDLNPIEQAYMDAWFAQCVDIWKIAGPDGYLWDTGNADVEPYTVADCQAWATRTDAAVYEEVPDAALGGADDAKRWMAARLLDGKLRNADGSKTWSG
jgi:hypothetical protein